MTTRAFIVLTALFAAVSLAHGQETEKWHDDFFEITIPKGWRVQRVRDDANRWNYEIFKGTTKLFDASVFRGGPRFIDCACARPQFYRHTQDATYEMWAFELDFNGRTSITWKVAAGEMRLSLHVLSDDAEIAAMRDVVYSARPWLKKP